MIEPYQAIGLVPTMWGIRRREDIRRNLEHIDHLVTAATWLGGLDLPVRLVAIPEGALQGFNDEVLDVDHETFARECAIDIPGPETDELGRLAIVLNDTLARLEQEAPESLAGQRVVDPGGRQAQGGPALLQQGGEVPGGLGRPRRPLVLLQQPRHLGRGRERVPVHRVAVPGVVLHPSPDRPPLR